MKIFNDIQESISCHDDSPIKLKESAIDKWPLPALMEFYDVKLKYLAKHAYSIRAYEYGYDLALRAFKESARSQLRTALITYLFKKEHWRKESSNLKGYLSVVLERLSNKIYWENSSLVKTRKFICPLCKIKHGSKEVLIEESKMLRCNWCTECANVLAKDIKQNDKDIYLKKEEIKIRILFSLHSKNGYRCQECIRFIPDSIKDGEYIVCPYNDCGYFGPKSDLMVMSHPIKVATRQIASINAEMGNKDEKVSLDTFLKSEGFGADLLLETKSDMIYKIKLIKSVIKDQLSFVRRNNGSATMVQKTQMYKAYSLMTEEYPEDMIHYLCHRKQIDEPIQAKIFQKYVSYMENYIPFTINKSGVEIDILSLTDPNLSLFTGVSTFNAKIGLDFIIPNLTKEIYIGGRNYKDYGPCFIGKLISLTDKEGVSIIKDIDSYSFSKIIMNKTVTPETEVIVSHYRMPSHYEMNGLVFLQRIRRQIVDSIYFKMYNKKREIVRGN